MRRDFLMTGFRDKHDSYTREYKRCLQRRGWRWVGKLIFVSHLENDRTGRMAIGSHSYVENAPPDPRPGKRVVNDLEDRAC